jgi:quercetin dioxygenase-like cupin family protein
VPPIEKLTSSLLEGLGARHNRGGSPFVRLATVFYFFTMSTTPINANTAPQGAHGEKQLAAGQHVALRLWENEQPGEPKPLSSRPYETVGYVLKGRAELHLEGEVTVLETGSSYLVPQGASHTYNILESFTAVEATSPPAK